MCSYGRKKNETKEILRVIGEYSKALDLLDDYDHKTLTALTLLIAESNPKEKEVIIDLVMNFLSEEQYQYLKNENKLKNGLKNLIKNFLKPFFTIYK